MYVYNEINGYSAISMHAYNEKINQEANALFVGLQYHH